MLRPVRVDHKDFAKYRDIIGYPIYNEIKKLAKDFRGARILHVNATSRGGGVAQILQSLIPLQRDLDIDAHWKLIEPKDMGFYVATKKIHNSMQGSPQTLSAKEWKLYDRENQGFAKGFKAEKWDYIIIHDPQPAGVLNYASENNAKWAWRCHIDLSTPNPSTKRHLLPYLQGYDGAIFTLKQYTLKGLKVPHTGVIPVAIDPLAKKNKHISFARAHMLVAGYGVDVKRPLMVQISRFDPWKDPLGVVKAWEIAKQEIPDLQLVLMGDAADDDPEGLVVLEQVLKRTKGKSDLRVITDTNDEAVNAFQSVANVVLQKSIREGFGLTVTEALWAKRPVVGGKVGGIPEQIKHGKNGYLVTSPEEAAKYVVKLIKDPLKAQSMGLWGHEYVREHFLLPHMLKADLKFLQTL